MNLLFTKLLAFWVTGVTNHTRLVLATFLFLFIASILLIFNFAKINSDFSSLINPSEALAWYQNNEEYKQSFPMSEQTAFVVVNGRNYNQVESITRQVSTELKLSNQFKFVFVPGQSHYLGERKLYFLSVEALQSWLTGLEYDFGALLRLSEDAGVGNSVNIYSDIVSSNLRMPLPDPIRTLSRSLELASKIDLEISPPLYDVDSEMYYQLIIVKGRQNLDERLPNKELIDNLGTVVDEFSSEEEVQIRISGELALANDEISAGLSGVGIAGTISLLLLLVILGFGIRSYRLIMSIFLLLMLGVVFTMALAILTVGSFNTLSLIFVVMFFGLGVDFAVHFLLRLKEAQKTSAVPSVVAIEDIGTALGLCVVTSVIAFLSFVPTAYAGLGELGIISAGGMIIAFVLTITLLPALVDKRSKQGSMSSRASIPLIPLLFDVQQHAPKVITVTILLSLLALSFAKNIQFDYSVLAMRDASTEAMETLLDLQDEKLMTDYSIAVLAKNAEEAKALKEKLLLLDEVGDVVTPMDFIPEDQLEKQRMMRGVGELFTGIDEILPAATDVSSAIEYLKSVQDEIPVEDRDRAKSVLNRLVVLESDIELLTDLDKQIEGQLGTELKQLKKMLLAAPFNLMSIPEEYRSRLITEDGKHLLMVQPSAPLLNREITEAFIDAVREIAPNYAGRSVVEWGVGEVVVESFLEAGLLTLVLISILLLFYFKSLVLTSLVLVPIFLSLLFTFAICDITGMSLNMANVLVVPLIIGLGVDTGIHVVHRYHSIDAHQQSVREVYQSSTLIAVLISGLTTIGTFFSLSFSPHKGAASIGILLTIAISLLLMATFIVLPALLSILNARSKYGVNQSTV